MNNSSTKIAFGAPQLQFPIGNSNVSGFILKDQTYTVSLRDLQKAFEFDVKYDYRFTEILQHISRFKGIPAELNEAFLKPVLAYYEPQEMLIKTINIQHLPLLIITIIDAKNNGLLNVNQLKAAKTAVLWEKFTSQDFKRLIDDGSGFNFQKTTAKKKLQVYFQNQKNDPVFEWIRTFPDEFFVLVNNLYGFDWNFFCIHPETYAKHINELVFSRLESALLIELTNQKPKRSYTSKTAQNLQHAVLKAHFDHLQQLALTAQQQPNIFRRLLQAAFPINAEWALKDSDFIIESKPEKPLSSFNETLVKSLNVVKK